MNLYGASLRKGEYPDEISAKAESLTVKFLAEATKLDQISDIKSLLDATRKALDEYLTFAKLPDSSDSQRTVSQ